MFLKKEDITNDVYSIKHRTHILRFKLRFQTLVSLNCLSHILVLLKNCRFEMSFFYHNYHGYTLCWNQYNGICYDTSNRKTPDREVISGDILFILFIIDFLILKKLFWRSFLLRVINKGCLPSKHLQPYSLQDSDKRQIQRPKDILSFFFQHYSHQITKISYLHKNLPHYIWNIIETTG
jgi:hypothetical protein